VLLDHPRLSPRQRELIGGWLPGAILVRDHSWVPISTTVIEVELEHELARFVVKARDAHDHHIARDQRKTILTVAAFVFSVASFTLAFRQILRSAVASKRPVLVFIYDGERGWILRNVGSSPALNVVAAQKRPGTNWVNLSEFPLCPKTVNASDTGLGAVARHGPNSWCRFGHSLPTHARMSAPIFSSNSGGQRGGISVRHPGGVAGGMFDSDAAPLRPVIPPSVNARRSDIPRPPFCVTQQTPSAWPGGPSATNSSPTMSLICLPGRSAAAGPRRARSLIVAQHWRCPSSATRPQRSATAYVWLLVGFESC
jgi:hypothetical protein